MNHKLIRLHCHYYVPYTSSLRVGLEASEATDVTLLVSYVVSNASWTSAYDVRVFTKNKTMKVRVFYL